MKKPPPRRRDYSTLSPARPQLPRATTPRPAGTVRLIGGNWRGTRLAVPDMPGLRPTSDRVRETLFNWLAPQLPGARVLDLFAGSGALGLEAVSRGAANAVLVERDPTLAAVLRDVVARLPGGDAVTVVQADAMGWLGSQPEGGYDIAFVDPPFADDMWNTVLPVLTAKLSARAWLYIEAPISAKPTLPGAWRLHREGQTREVRYALYRRAPPRQEPAADTLQTDATGIAPVASN